MVLHGQPSVLYPVHRQTLRFLGLCLANCSYYHHACRLTSWKITPLPGHELCRCVCCVYIVRTLFCVINLSFLATVLEALVVFFFFHPFPFSVRFVLQPLVARGH